MAGAACKIIINNGIGGLSKSIEQVLTSPLVRGLMLGIEECDRLIDRLAKVDLACYNPDIHPMPKGGLRGILLELKDYGVITDEVIGLEGLFS